MLYWGIMKSAPIILGFDTSAHHCTAAVLRGHDVLVEQTEAMSKGQAERLMGLLEECLKNAEASFQELTAIGVGIGPGNFTGIRIAVSAARGLALGLNCPSVGVSGFDALRLGTDGPCACTITAPREQVYVQRFDALGSTPPPELVPAHSLPAHEGPLIGAGGSAPVFPTAVAIAMLARDRYETETRKPAPLYLRPPDAAPARDSSPVILK